MRSAEQLRGWVTDARASTLGLFELLSDAQLEDPRRSELVNPFLWEFGHVAWFQEQWILRRLLGREPLRADTDAVYDSGTVPHDTRWDLPLSSRAQTRRALERVRDDVLELLDRRDLTPELQYFVTLTVFHEDLHWEAFTTMAQLLAFPMPGVSRPPPAGEGGPLAGDVEIPGGAFLLGARDGEHPFVFDNEKWGHEVVLDPFCIARAPVTQGEFQGFVDEGGYAREDLWSTEGWTWRRREDAAQPLFWRREGDRWMRRVFTEWVDLEPHRPMVHVCWHEAQAYCRWAGRRLPTEAEWEQAAATGPGFDAKRLFPWGIDGRGATQTNLDWTGDTVDVAHFEEGDSAWGCRQLLGNVWEWTSSVFQPYPGFVLDPYEGYSKPYFGFEYVLRGGCWANTARLLRNTYRKFYEPHRRDILAGFRTCALDS